MAQKVEFKKAVPVWELNMEHEKNHSLIFKETVSQKAKTLRVAGASVYSIYVNGDFLATGPARTAHGFYRVDEIPLCLTKAENEIEIHITVANLHSFYMIYVPGFLCCEIEDADGQILRATGFDFKDAYRNPFRVKKVPRFSFQRTFMEVYNMKTGFDKQPITLQRTADKCFIEREVYYPDYHPVTPDSIAVRGKITLENEVIRPCKNRCLIGIPDVTDGYRQDELQINPADEVGSLTFTVENTNRDSLSVSNTEISANHYAIYEFAHEVTGLLSFEVVCEKPCTLYFAFDEQLENSETNYLRLSSINLCQWNFLEKGRYRITTYEPYSFMYLNAIAKGGDLSIQNFSILSIGFPEIDYPFTTDDPTLQKIYDAGIETFRQNAYDIYTDCPSRERAGWLCDSFFTARVEYALTQKSVIEKCFLENFMLPDSFKNLPHGMLPMCYPADFIKGEFIPNWAMFYVIELAEYYNERNGDAAFVQRIKPKIYDLLAYFKPFENENGLLCKLESWIFVEWSDCNKYVQDINFPTNMLYAMTKKAVAQLYCDQSLLEESERLRDEICRLSYKDGFFHDRAMLENGKPSVTDEITETCQYYAFFCNIATPKTHTALWETLQKDFGPSRRNGEIENKWPHISFSNAFIGNYLRLELLHRYGESEQLIDNIKKYFGFMAEKTGTLWEHDCADHSLNHGFGSHVIVWLISQKEKGNI